MTDKTKYISLYIHIPFCVKKCLFCSFAVSIGQAHRVDDYIAALEKEAAQYKGLAVRTVYLGGGTPSFLSAPQLERVVRMVRSNFSVEDDAEWVIENNPEGIDVHKALALKALGFTRVSLGVQSFNDAYLKFLGRAHDRGRAVQAFADLRAAGFGNINVDLMYGFPKQTRAALHADLEAVAALQSEHVSIYTLTVEPNSRFYATQMKLDGDDKLADDYVYVTEYLEKAGFQQYEVSNFARPGFRSKHNMAYWQGGGYVGLGMGAHSFMGNFRVWNTEHLNQYLDQISTDGRAIAGYEDLDARTQFMERLVFGLRMNAGIRIPIIEKEQQYLASIETMRLIDGFIKDGFLVKEGEYIKTTLQGRLVLDELAARLI